MEEPRIKRRIKPSALKKRARRVKRLGHTYYNRLQVLEGRVAPCHQLCHIRKVTPKGKANCATRCVTRFQKAAQKRTARFNAAIAVKRVRKQPKLMREHLRGVMKQLWGTRWAHE